jgi:hypothetical protein
MASDRLRFDSFNPALFETRSLPSSLATTHRGFALITRTAPVLAPATLAALPSTGAIETRSLPTSLAATHRGFAFYVALPKSSIPPIATCSMPLASLWLPGG